MPVILSCFIGATSNTALIAVDKIGGSLGTNTALPVPNSQLWELEEVPGPMWRFKNVGTGGYLGLSPNGGGVDVIATADMGGLTKFNISDMEGGQGGGNISSLEQCYVNHYLTVWNDILSCLVYNAGAIVGDSRFLIQPSSQEKEEKERVCQ